MDTIYPIGIQNFEKIRTGGYLYIDKTELVYRLVKTGSYYFLSRPRRFGKSLLISTLEAYFQGKKDLFKGLAMEGLEKDWVEYPVLHLDLNAKKFDNFEDLIRLIDRQLLVYENQYGSEPTDVTIDDRFVTLIRNAREKSGQRVVVLVDEYDKPLLQAIGNDSLQTEYRNMLKAFYGVLKTMDGSIKFAMLTGVTKFGKVSVFSDLNNLKDITMDHRYVELCGITEAEIHRFLEDPVLELAQIQGLAYDEVCTKLEELYDGYHFAANTIGLYNPFSLLNTFDRMEFGDYWFETGTPSYLLELLKRSHYNLYDMAHALAKADMLNSIDPLSYDPIPVIYQSGYLTIKSYDERFQTYTLGFPNKEVELGFMDYLLPYYANVKPGGSPFQIEHFIREVEGGHPESFLTRLQSFFADTPYELARDLEVHFQNVLYIVFKLVGFYVQAEYRTSNGRIDLVLQTPKYIYVMEFKLHGSAEDAIRQIEEKGYAQPFASDSRKLFLIGVNFSLKDRNMERWIILNS